MDGRIKFSSDSIPLPTLLSDPQVGPNNMLQGDAVRRIALAAMAAGGLGAAVRGIQGMNAAVSKPPAPVRIRTMLPIPVPAPEDPEKRANSPNILETAANHAANWLGLMRAPGQEPPGFLSGWDRSFGDKPWVYAAGVPLAGAAFYGGYKGVGAVADSLKQNDQENELEEARKRYESALLGHGAKTASDACDADVDDELALLDQLAEKRATLGAVAGMGLLGLGGLTALSGVSAYQYARGNSQRKALEAALRRRQEAMLAMRPPTITAIPVPVRPELDEDNDPNDLDDLAPKAAGSLTAAAQSWIQRDKQQQAAAWQALMPQTDKPKPAEKSQEPPPITLPSVVAAPAQPPGG